MLRAAVRYGLTQDGLITSRFPGAEYGGDQRVSVGPAGYPVKVAMSLTGVAGPAAGGADPDGLAPVTRL